MNNGRKNGLGKSRLAEPNFRHDALAKQARSQQLKAPLTPMPPIVRPHNPQRPEATTKPPTGSQRRAAKRQENLDSEAASKRLATEKKAVSSIGNAFKAYQVRKGLKAASLDLQASIKGDMPDRLAKLVGQNYVDSGLLKATSSPISKASGRLAGDWGGGVDTQKRKLNALPRTDQIGTVHHTVSDHFLGFVNEGVKRLEGGSTADKKAALGFRTQVAKDSLYEGTDHERALFQVRQNLTYGPIGDRIKGDPGIGFDASFSTTRTPGLSRDWDQRSSKVRPVHNLGLLLKSGHFDLTAKGADHLSTRLESARKQHDTDLHGVSYDVPTTTLGKGGVPSTKIEQRAQTIPVHDVASGHFDALKITQKKGVVDGFQKRKWK